MDSLLKQIDDINYGENFSFSWESMGDLKEVFDTMKHVVCDMNIVDDSTFTLSKSRLNRLVRMSKKKNPELNTYLWRVKKRKCLVCAKKTTTTVCKDCYKSVELNRCSKTSCKSVIPFGWHYCISHHWWCDKTDCENRTQKYTSYHYLYCDEHKLLCVECKVILGTRWFDTKTHCSEHRNYLDLTSLYR